MGKNYILEDESTAKFNLKEFRTLVSRRINNNRKNGLKATREEIFFDIQEKYTIPAETIKRWYKGNGSPQDIEKVENLAEYFEIIIDDLLIFDDSDVIQVVDNSETGKEQMKMKNYYKQYEEDPRLEIKRNDIPVNAEIRWFVRDVYIDLYKYITDVLFYDQIIETDNCPEMRQDPGYPLFYVKLKINQYRMDLPEEAVEGLYELAEYLERVPFYSEMNDLPEFFDENASEKEIIDYFEGWSLLGQYYSFALERNHNPLSMESEERSKVWMTATSFYEKVQQDFFNMAKRLLGQYFE